MNAVWRGEYETVWKQKSTERNQRGKAVFLTVMRDIQGLEVPSEERMVMR